MIFASFLFLTAINAVYSLMLTNATVPVRIEFTTCTTSGSGSSSKAFNISFPSVSSFPSQQISSTLSNSASTYHQVYFLEEYPSSISLFALTADSLCLSSIEVNGVNVAFPEGNIWLDSPCSGTYGNNEVCKQSNVWTFPQVSYQAAPVYGVQVEFTTCSSSSSTSSGIFYVSFPSIPSFLPQQFSETFSQTSTTYVENYYPLPALPTDISVASHTADSLCLSGITINQVKLNFTTNIWLDDPCTSSYYGSEPCYTTHTWNFTNISSYGEVMYFYYHTCTYSDSSSNSLNFYVDFPKQKSYVENTLDWTFSSPNNWFYQVYYVDDTPSKLKMTAQTTDEICLDSIRFNEFESFYLKKSHYYLDNPCDPPTADGTNYSDYCATSITWSVNQTTNHDDDDSITVDDIQFLIQGALISGLTTIGLLLAGIMICCCYVNNPSSRKYLGKDEIITRTSTANPLNAPLHSDGKANSGNKKTITLPAVEVRLNATSGAPQADAINQEYDHIIRLALQDINHLAENDQEYLIGKIRFAVSSSKITKFIEFIVMTVLGGVSISIDTCPNWFCKMYLVISLYILFLTIILRLERYPFSPPSIPKPIERKIYESVVAERVGKYQDRVYYEWDRNKNGKKIRVYEEPEVGTDEVQVAADFAKYQQTLKNQNRLQGSVFKFTPREWSKERAEAKATVEEINAKNLAAAREENRKRELKQQEMDRERHEKDKMNLETYRANVINHEVWVAAWEVTLSYLYCLVSFCSVILFVVGLFWNVTCSATGSVLCNFIVFPTIVFEFMFIITYTKREKMSFEARKETVINV